jgi:hypothetical protein
MVPPASSTGLSSVFTASSLAVFICSSLVSTPEAQVVVDPAWVSNRDAIARLTVAIEAGESTDCVSAGLLVGYDATRAYIVTANNPLQETLLASPNEPPPLFVSTQPPSGAGRGRAVRVAATMIHKAVQKNLAVLTVTDAAMLETIKQARFDILGNGTELVRRDLLSALGCDWVQPTAPVPRPLLGLIKNTRDLMFDGAELNARFVGGPVMHLAGTQPVVVGMLTVVRERAEGRRVDAVFDDLRAWRVPVMLTGRGTRVGCTYRYAITNPHGMPKDDALISLGSLGPSMATVTIDTSSDCPWTAWPDTSTWMRVADDASSLVPVARRTGPGQVAVGSSRHNACDGRTREGIVYVADHMIRVQQDGTWALPCP